MSLSKKAETITCPARFNQLGPWEREEGLDKWETDRWEGDRRFVSGYEPPRTCSFCGGCHPDDATRLIDEGWHWDPTDKPYKFLIEPPGTADAVKFVRAYLRTGLPHAHVQTPIPPVKYFTWHSKDASTPEQEPESSR